MRGFLLTLVLALSFWTFFRFETEPDPTYELIVNQSIGERIVQLPEDGQAWHLNVFTQAENYQGTARDRELMAAFSVDPICQSLKAQTHYHHIPASSGLYKSKWSQYVTTLPAIVLQDGKGKVIYKASGHSIPATPAALGDELANAIDYASGRSYDRYSPGQCGPNRPCPQPRPDLGPGPDYAPYRPLPNGIPDVSVRGPKLFDGVFDQLFQQIDRRLFSLLLTVGVAVAAAVLLNRGPRA